MLRLEGIGELAAGVICLLPPHVNRITVVEVPEGAGDAGKLANSKASDPLCAAVKVSGSWKSVRAVWL